MTFVPGAVVTGMVTGMVRVVVVVASVVVARVVFPVIAAGGPVRGASALLPSAGFERGTSRFVPGARAVRDAPAAETGQRSPVLTPRIGTAAAKVAVALGSRRPAVG